GADLCRARAAGGAGRDEGLDEAPAAEQPLLLQRVEGLGDQRPREAAGGQLALELEPAVLAARKQRDGAALAVVEPRLRVLLGGGPEAPVRPGPRHPPPLRPAPRPRPSSAAASRESSPRYPPPSRG